MYGSASHQLWLAMERFYVPQEITNMLERYFLGFLLRFSLSVLTTAWTYLQVGITMVCMILPILFIMAMQVILDVTSEFAQGPRLSEEIRMPH